MLSSSKGKVRGCGLSSGRGSCHIKCVGGVIKPVGGRGRHVLPLPIFQVVGEKINFSATSIGGGSTLMGIPPLSGGISGGRRSRTPSPHARQSHTSSPIATSSLLSSQVATPTTKTGHAHHQDHAPIQAPRNSRKRAWHGGMADVSPTNQQASLTPEKFQVPVQMLNSLAAEGAAASSGHMTGHMTSQEEAEMMSPQEKKKRVKRRNSSVSGSPLDDQGTVGTPKCGHPEIRTSC